MPKRNRHTPEQIIRKLREAEVGLSKGQTTAQAKRLKELEKENARLEKVVADQALDKAILKEALSGNY